MKTVWSFPWADVQASLGSVEGEGRDEAEALNLGGVDVCDITRREERELLAHVVAVVAHDQAHTARGEGRTAVAGVLHVVLLCEDGQQRLVGVDKIRAAEPANRCGRVAFSEGDPAGFDPEVGVRAVQSAVEGADLTTVDELILSVIDDGREFELSLKVRGHRIQYSVHFGLRGLVGYSVA